MRAISLRNLITEFGLITSLHANQIGVRKQERAKHLEADITSLEVGIKTLVSFVADEIEREIPLKEVKGYGNAQRAVIDKFRQKIEEL